MRIRPVNMEFRYGTAFMSESPEAYERLILDAMRGDATLFTRNDEIEALWGIIDPILTAWHEDTNSEDPAVRRRHRGPRGGQCAAGARAAVAATVSDELTEPASTTTLWSEQDTTPDDDRQRAATDAARAHAENEALVPARVLNMVVLVDRDWKGEIANRLGRVGRYHASRTVLCAVEPGRTTLDAWAAMSYDEPRGRRRGDARAGGDRPRSGAPGAPGHDRSTR